MALWKDLHAYMIKWPLTILYMPKARTEIALPSILQVYQDMHQIKPYVKYSLLVYKCLMISIEMNAIS